MTDVISILPDSIANQIAAGEVIQRPASAVKELLENAVDAGATIVNVFIKDAGKSLIQINDNGCGMSETDARLSFERHATSKIKIAEDLFRIRTMGFRGEALASIASIAQVEMKTKRAENETGTMINMEASKIQKQEPVSTANGTNILVKNIFFNLPARRNFLKSDSAEMKHIVEEFQRVVLAYYNVTFTLNHNGIEVYHLTKSNMRQRIVALFGDKKNEWLIPIDEKTDNLTINGFISKPQFAKKIRGEQLFFVNQRFIKSAYLNHAVITAYQELLPKESFPLYILFLEINPSLIDVNVHPTKTEIKFSDDKFIYAIVRSSIRHALGKFNITPTLDFKQEPSIDQILLESKSNLKRNVSMASNLSEKDLPSFPGQKYVLSLQSKFNQQSDSQDWEKLYGDIKEMKATQQPSKSIGLPDLSTDLDTITIKSSENKLFEICKHLFPYQVHKKYIFSHIKSGLLIIDQHKAHERILYEEFLKYLNNKKGISQQTLFPLTIELNSQDFDTFKEIHSDLKLLGFDISEFGNNTVIINGIPPHLQNNGISDIFYELLHQYRENLTILNLSKNECLAKSLAKKTAIPYGTDMSIEEMNKLIDGLFSCQYPSVAPNKTPVVFVFNLEEIDKRFEKLINY